MELSAAQMDEVIMAIHGIAPEKRGALEARTRHFKRLGFPRGANVGRGRSVRYEVGQVISMLLAFELSEFGINPERIAALLSKAGRLELPIANDFVERMQKQDRPNLIIHIDPRALGILGDTDEDASNWLGDNDAVDFADRWLVGDNRFNWRRRALIDATELMKHAALALEGLDICTIPTFSADLRAYVEGARAEITKSLGTF